MRITKSNIRNFAISDLLDYELRFAPQSNRRSSSKQFSGKPNCSGYNINKLMKDGMTVGEYQSVIESEFDRKDPQFSTEKHLRYDIEHGNIELVRSEE